MSDLHIHFHGDVAAGATLVITVPQCVSGELPAPLADAIATLGDKVRAIDLLVADLQPPAPQPPEGT